MHRRLARVASDRLPTPACAAPAALLALALATAAWPCAATTLLPPTTVAALGDLWRQTGGEQGGWTRCLGWADGSDPCVTPWGRTQSGGPAPVDDDDAYGSVQPWGASVCFVCNDATTALVALDLFDANLTGAIPDSVGALTELTYLGLGRNNLSGAVPLTIGGLTRLRFLGLADNSLTGRVPADALGSLTALVELGLNGNRFDGSVPATVGGLTALTYLSLEDNRLDGIIPPAVFAATALRTLSLSGNALVGVIPGAIGGLMSLTSLSLANNRLTGPIPASVCALTALTEVSLQGNLLFGLIPECIGGMASLQQLGLGNNRLGGVIPPSLGNLSELTGLGLFNNSLVGVIPDALGRLTRLTYLDLFGNQLSDRLPASLGGLAALTELDVASNRLNGALPASLGNLTLLSTLTLNNNEFSGTLPASLGNLTALTTVALSSNALNGSIPEFVSRWTVLSELSLAHNQFSCVLGAWLGGLTSLTQLGLAGNHLTGPIPDSVANLTRLNQLSLSSNKFNGTVPAWLGGLTMLTNLALDGNELTGAIPPSLGGLTRLTFLALSNNRLTGDIPRTLGNLTLLRKLHLFQNRLTGAIPPELGSLTLLVEMLLYDNLLSGAVPAALGRLTALDLLLLSSNRLGGGIPPAIGSLTRLVSLDLSGNDLTGAIPDELASLSALRFLRLDNNNLGGVLPPWLGSTTTLTSLLLSNNPDLGGVIPDSVGNLAGLTNLSLGYTAVGGSIPTALCGLRRLVNLLAPYTLITGELPACVGELALLEYLDLRGTALTGRLPESLLGMPRLMFLLVSNAHFDGGIPEARGGARNVTPPCVNQERNETVCRRHLQSGCCSPITANLAGPAACPLSADVVAATCTLTCRMCFPGYTGPLPLLRTLVLLESGLTGTIPAWVGELPQVGTVEISGNALTGSIPAFGPLAPLQQFSAANNRLSGTLDPLAAATQVTLLSLEGNSIGGRVGPWLTDLAGNATLISLSDNHVSCRLPDPRRGVASDATVAMLMGNVFACPVPRAIERSDVNANAYVCGSSDLEFAGYFLFTVLIVMAGAVAALLADTSRLYAEVGRTAADADGADRTRRQGHEHDMTAIERLLAADLAVAVVALVVVVLPVFATSMSVVECRYGWESTAAFLASLTDSGGDGVAWPYVLAAVGLALGGGVAAATVAAGVAKGVVTVRALGDGLQAAQWAVAAAVFAFFLAMLVGINVVFVLAQESTKASDASKHAVLVFFALIHELVDHAVSPLIVSALSLAAAGAGRGEVQPPLVFSAAVALEMANSVLAPVVALLVASEGCYKDELFAADTAPASANVSYCAANGIPVPVFDTAAQCAAAAERFPGVGLNWTNYDVASYTPPFRFDGERCLSSIITLYTPEYLVVFALRMLAYPLAWWLAQRGTPWLLAGIRPPARLRPGFLSMRRRLVAVFGCCACGGGGGGDGDGVRRASVAGGVQGDDNNENGGNDGDDDGGGGGNGSAGTGVGATLTPTLHAIEPAVHSINLLSITVCFGMVSPALAAGAGASCAVKTAWLYATDRWSAARAFQGADDAGNKGHEEGQDEGHHHVEHPMPALCVAQLLLFQSMYVVVVLQIAGALWAALTVVAVGWAAFAVACWRCAEPRRVGENHRGAVVSEANPAFELSERLLSPADREE